MTDCRVIKRTINCITGAICVAVQSEFIPSYGELYQEGRCFVLQANGSHNPSELHGEVPHNCNIFDFFILRIFFEKTGADQVTEVYEERIQFERTPGPVTPDPEINLSFCIPTYNRGQRVREAVESILASERQDIEVVVSDNCSTDDTISLLSTITDPRLKVFSNSRNYGAVRNLHMAMAHGRGQFVYLHSDEDTIATEELPNFIGFLNEHPEIGAGIASVMGAHRFPATKVFDKGKASLLRAAVGITYLGGFFFKRSALVLDFLFPEYDNPAFLYPFEILLWSNIRDACLCLYAPIVTKRGKSEKSFISPCKGRHFNHPTNLIDQYLYRCKLFTKLATGCCDEESMQLAFKNFRRWMLVQNFIFCFDLPLEEKLELVWLIHKHVPEVLSENIIKSLFAQIFGIQILNQNNDEEAAQWLRKAIEFDTRNFEAGFLLASILEKNNDKEELDNIYRYIIKNTPRRSFHLVRIYNEFKKRNRPEEMKQICVLLEDPQLMTPTSILESL
ncbi:MAG: glycosyltransferase [Solidesulfovibrio sp.]|jgi:glycosyltransferase involved in cell wall biosynthesis|uniref:glycosyltransferase n=1 Tax=Solidesulfovibrio sp. TaxID=2910990 RepID=UPI002B217EE7|nr:glycosyltransferase [Solidesulfovibrio sp.]MEA4855622.1 glycosyltransferase [Solidesulfovibrio sp.]